MKKLLCCGLLLLIGAGASPASAPATLDLTPRSAGSLDGFSRLYFLDGGKKFTVNRSADTEVTGTPTEATFRFTQLQSATLSLRTSPYSPKETFDEENLAAYRQAAGNFAPPGIGTPPEVEEIPSPLPVHHWSSHRFIALYRLPGNSIKQAVTFVNLDSGQQLCLVLTAFEPEFNEALAQADSLIRSWRAVNDTELTTPSLN